MSHQIYYTSAPQGLKRGTSGFCSVAATDNLPKPLWDRLETLSAYRHHFAAGQSERANDQNPVSYAHWTLSVASKTYHVLSRVCDSGVDHTHRTNAFAHHLVVEPADMEAAPGGPAWLLEQPGVMAAHWDNQVGSLPPARIPPGDTMARICSHWAALTGDAGWGGHLADSFVKAPARPICLLFSPGQDILPLMAEALALLPPLARWNITFNTYFTSMPTSATCLWRCCLAGTPAAQVGLRYAANGLVLDLTDRSRLPALPPGPYVTAARTGQSPLTAKPAAAAKRPAAAAAAVAPPAGAGPRLDRGKDKAPLDDEDDELEKQRNKFFDFAAEEAQLQSSGGGEYDLAGEENASAPVADLRPADAAPARRGDGGLSGFKKKAVSLRKADENLYEAERDADRDAARRRKQILWMFLGAVGALAAGTVAIVLLQNTGGAAPQPAPRVVQPRINKPDTEPVIPGTQVTPVNTQPIVTSQTAPAIDTQPKVVDTQPVTTIPVATLPAAPVFPDVVAISLPMSRPNVASGMGSSTQSLPLKLADLDNLATVTGLALHMPPRTMKPGTNAPGTLDSTYTADAGTFTATPANRLGKLGVALSWKPNLPSAQPLEFATVQLDKNRPGLEVEWKAGPILRMLQNSADSFPLAFWLVQNATLELESPRKTNQKLTFAPFDPPPIALKAAGSTIPWTVDLPHDTTVVPPRLATLPTGWDATWYTDWEQKDAAMRTRENASQVIKFKRVVSGVDLLFTLTFRPGLARVESTYGKNVDELKADLARNQTELTAAEAGVQDAIEKLKAMGLEIDKDPGGIDRLNRRDQAKKLVDALKTAIAAYEELTSFSIGFESPDGVRFATVKFKNDAGKPPDNP